MRSRVLGVRWPGAALAIAALTAALLLAGALIWFLPYLTREQQPVAEVPTPPALFVRSEFVVPPHQRACMESVTITPSAGLAEFQLRPATASPGGGPPVELVLSAPGYKANAQVPGGYPGGGVTVPIAPPKHATVGSACFINLGTVSVQLDG